ncbi:MerR family transcriptional regulator [Antarcticibacterium arcticum]|uniref:MerR family transcriptional regulator n=1 Tax=Antarcticibacterium arcticum TaxID=2585771 RepID=A0A5B8YM52_9FLAO|nr:MerR family transcriptional regulator [Antarcticibacterium arcticum]QED38795.1 MerR family transcriptional regulator [Antarcticibacterium arcticum]
MDFIKQSFSIKDFEYLTGIKAHTIRIWEKRYNILDPERTPTNIRTYSIENLQRILNVSFLNNNGYKISRISKMSHQEAAQLALKVAASKSVQHRAVNSFKIAMLGFNEELFNKTYKQLLATKSFRQIFHEIFLPLLEEIGLLWQTHSIKPVHEHFVSMLIKQKINENIALLEPVNTDSDLYVLFLPENEIHDLGLLFLNYELNFYKQKTIYLGPSFAIKDLKYLLEIHPNPKFISYLTVSPREVADFISEFDAELCQDQPRELNLLGARIQSLDSTKQLPHIKIFKSIPEFINGLD